MIQLRKENRLYLQSQAFCDTGQVCHGFTGRQGGVSAGQVSGLNLGFRVGDDPEAVRANYRLVAGDLGLDYEKIVATRQAHTDHVLPVTLADAGKGVSRESDIFDTDGLLTDCPGLPLVVFAADCVPILLLDPVRRAVGAVHAGWRGTVQGIAARAAALLASRYGCDPGNILAAIGPSLGPCCFAFSRGDADCFPQKYWASQAGDKVYVDLWAMNRDQLLEAGLTETHIETAEVCTVCHQDEYYSYRAHGVHTGRQGALIMLL